MGALRKVSTDEHTRDAVPTTRDGFDEKGCFLPNDSTPIVYAKSYFVLAPFQKALTPHTVRRAAVLYGLRGKQRFPFGICL